MNDKYIVYFISKTKKKMIGFISNQLQARGLTDLVPSYGNILTALYDHGGTMNMKEIGDLVGKEKSTVTALVVKLEKLGYVTKEKSREDKRITNVLLTDKALSIRHTFNEISADVNKTAYKNFTPEEKTEFLRLLKKLNGNFDA